LKNFLIFYALFCANYIFANAKVFIYHRFGDSRYESANISLDVLKSHFNYLKENNYKVVPLNKIIYKLKKREEIPSNWVALTIDDAYKSFYTNAFPIFKEFDYPFTLFVYVEATNKRYGDYMSWEQLREMDEYGATIALHSYSHPHLVDLSSQKIAQDTKKSIEIFQEKMGFYPLYYAYPYGEYDERVRGVVKTFGFLSIFNQSLGTVSSSSDIYDIDRIAIDTNSSIEEKLKYSRFDAKILEPTSYPIDGVIKRVKAKVPKNLKSVKLYISGYGWQNCSVEDGILDIEVNKEVTKDRVRVIIGNNLYNINSTLLVKKR
jgi:peptidoglycan/xylan/chitin deacetylase (PgdA/CDA1 family)